ncbi:winged helix-turn-helix transcriptional regulator [Rhizosphaericola mali]|uniref:Helix-turn-helix transcriptional regulator n=1 Tax=Rhizosphaericola mali TaxID=2545455 RepID=A0A5P2FZH5_9BACT|nr:helix-turn-helix domain-containing protein [Rhizosphaericola mali]QES88347.1 helix-turn-helix transcriptional regulator [Rhizosphaericola mali]
MPEINEIRKISSATNFLHIAECKKKLMAIHDTMDVISGKWKLSIIACLCYKPMRYSEILREIYGISGKVLSRELKDLEMNQLIKRKVLDIQPISVEYSITDYGATLQKMTEVIADWGIAHRQKIIGVK